MLHYSRDLCHLQIAVNLFNTCLGARNDLYMHLCRMTSMNVLMCVNVIMHWDLQRTIWYIKFPGLTGWSIGMANIPFALLVS